MDRDKEQLEALQGFFRAAGTIRLKGEPALKLAMVYVCAKRLTDRAGPNLVPNAGELYVDLVNAVQALD